MSQVIFITAIFISIVGSCAFLEGISGRSPLGPRSNRMTILGVLLLIIGASIYVFYPFGFDPNL